MASRAFTIGDTVFLRARVSEAGTRNPANPSGGVTLTRLAVDRTHVNLPGTTAFTKASDGLYVLALTTDSLAAGTYSWMALVDGGAAGKQVVEDVFVLALPTTVA